MTAGPLERISGYQMVAILFFVRLVPRTLICPTTMVQPPHQDLWVADAASAVLAVGFVFVVCQLGVRHQDRNIIEYSRYLLHPVLGSLIGIILAGYFLFVAAYTVRMLGEAFTITILPRTPVTLLIVMSAFLAANAARCGLEMVARMAELLLPLTVLLILAILVLPVSLVDSNHLRPLLAGGFSGVMPAASIEFMFYLEFIVLGMIIPHLHLPERATRYAVVFTVAFGIMAVIMCLVMIGIFGPTLDTLSLQVFMLARMIAVGQFVERIESLVLASWVLSTGVKLSALIWAVSAALQSSLGLKSRRHLCYVTGSLVMSVSLLLFDDVVHMVRTLAEPWTVVSVVLVLSLVGLLWAAHLLRKGVRV